MVSWRRRVKDLEAENSFLKSKIDELEKRLLAYENAHTPPSLSKKKPPKKESNGKLGAPKGHPKYEREDPEPNLSIEYEEDTCPHCDSKLNKPFKTDRILEEEIPEPRPIEVTEHLVNHYLCPCCNKHIIAKNNAPKERFGKNIQTHISLLKYEDRLPLRKVTNSLERHYGITITNVGVFKITNRVAKKLAAPYNLIIKRVRKAKVAYVDETGLKVDGINYHIWTFVTDNDVLFVIRRSRSKKVIEEILGMKFDGVISCDGWQVYSQYSDNLQRCWAHFLRESKHLAEKYTEFEGFHRSFSEMFVKIKKIRQKPPPIEKRKMIVEKLKSEMMQIVGQMNFYQEFRKFATTVENGLRHWFTCVTNLLVEPTNNNAERALRELVVQRKIIGGLRREKGARIMEVITSVIATLKKRDMQVFKTIKSYL